MPTISGSITTFGLQALTCPMMIIPTNGAFDSVNSAHGGGRVFAQVTGGTYSLTLAPGQYDVAFPGQPRFSIVVPTGAGTYTIDQIALTSGAGSTTVVSGIIVVDNLAQFHLSATNEKLVFLASDANGNSGWFKASSTATDSDDGVNAVHNANGVVYLRQQ